ncbi:anti-sigma factor family protein [Paraburkholderia susongensis]|uniref:Transmembrane transcriptional regulator (Anti-sigma factor RsiW) n=1 Tax=Paraburkholderia susongensis TaxID=1515439 RepID=A0A1X7M046_9BURK|nr:anti-sigma factor [Paraburkholderia susongensis]SMG58903.1 Transmembrane transcriptional regulator (anti-sigma factor RsiW) [Paraburkholderia susongensis]
MSEPQMPIGEEDLHAYVDGTLSDERRAEVERALEQNAELATRVSDYFSLNNLFHERYDRVLSEPVPKRLQMNAPRRSRMAANWPRFAAQFAGMAAALVLGVGIGMHKSGDLIAPVALDHVNTRAVSADSAEGFARQAAVAHVVYMPSVVRPSDMSADHEQDFVQWLANRLGTSVHPPMLSKSGFSLSGGRLLPGADGPTAQFMYSGPNGERVTLCISRRRENANTTAFKLYQAGPVNVFYWVDGDFGYAVSGGIDRKELLQLAHDVYAQLTGVAPG